MVNKKG